MTGQIPEPSEGAPRSRVLIVDDHPIFREGLAQSINREPDLVVCGEADNALQALDLVRSLLPDLVIADVALPGRSGLELVQDLHAAYPMLPVLSVSMHDESVYAARLLRSGARGYVMKQEMPQTILLAIRQVLRGGIYVSQRMASQILESYSGRRTRGSTSPIEELSDREFEVIHLIGQGQKGPEIAQFLGLSRKTVAVHQANIRRKLNLKTPGDLIRFAIRWEDGARSHPR